MSISYRCWGIARDFGPYISMVSPWLENGSLTACLRKYKDIILSDRLRLLEDITSGLHYLVHGDLTPNNVLLNDERRAVLTDFGLSSMLVDQGHSYLQRSCAQPGAVRYAAPELLNPNNTSIQPDTRSEVLSGHEPWADIKHEICIIFKVADGATPQMPVNSQISDAHWHLIDQCFTPLGATPPRPSTGKILTFLENKLQPEVSIAVIPSTGCSNEDEATTSFHDDVCIQMHSLLTIQTTVGTPQPTDPLKTSSTVDITQPIASPSHNLPSAIRNKGKGPAMGSQRTRKFISSLFRRSKSAQLDKKIKAQSTSIERDAATTFTIATNSLTRVQNFAVPPGGLGWQIGVLKTQKVAVKSVKALRMVTKRALEMPKKPSWWKSNAGCLCSTTIFCLYTVLQLSSALTFPV
ncbi:kinase-like protein [Rhizopogon vinicolor AM-OR11-026]|uniref:Kinase-like protein n=1 Tax=Rhizopogon vinicolor AM-OR11-026 TaxID=1314800 RepID=A0A1B7MY14_9AGAM|nr:kinase-like protein [Rhizopogon vinicolor AM-OR11-026]